MDKFDFLQKYVFKEGDERAKKSKHSFYNLSLEDIISAENRLGYKFPNEIRDFYFKVGYGFLWNEDQYFINRILDPESLADFILGEDDYEFDENRDDYEPYHMPFLEVSEVGYIYLDVSKKNDSGECPLYYFDEKIADSLQEFFVKNDKNKNYFIK